MHNGVPPGSGGPPTGNPGSYQSLILGKRDYSNSRKTAYQKALKACKGGKKPKLIFTGPQGPRFKPQGPGTNPHDHFYFPKGK